MSKNNHTHRYIRVITKNGNIIYRCNLPDCNHSITKEFISGKRSVCNRCNEEFILDSRALKFEKPYCVNCVRIRKKPSHDKLLEFVIANDTSSSKA